MLHGNEEPRVYTPPLRELTEDTSLGFAAIFFTEEILGLTLLPWQRWLFIHALEIVDDGNSQLGWRFRFRIIIVLVARQNGKSTMSVALVLFFMFCLNVALILGTAQDLDLAEEVWENAVDIVDGNAGLAAEKDKVSRTNGKKELRLKGGQRYIIKAANRKGARGRSADLVLMDELREQRTWDGWGAISKTTTARPNGIIWTMSNAGDATSVVLRHFRVKAHGQLGDPDGICKALGDKLGDPGEGDDIDGIGIFEWSAPPNCDIWDREAWCQSNPSLGYGFLTERTLASSIASDPEDVTRTETLCQWVEAVVQPPFPEGSWEAGQDGSSVIADDSPLWYGVDMATDRDWASIAVCGTRPDGTWHVELIAYERGVAWLKDWFVKRADPTRPMNVAIQGRGAPISSMGEVLEAIEGVNLHECTGPDVTGWCGRLWDAVASTLPDKDEGDEGSHDSVPVYHRPQAALDMAANVAVTRPLGDGAWTWDRKKSMADISPLVAANMAYGLATSIDKEDYISSYEDDGVLVL